MGVIAAPPGVEVAPALALVDPAADRAGVEIVGVAVAEVAGAVVQSVVFARVAVVEFAGIALVETEAATADEAGWSADGPALEAPVVVVVESEDAAGVVAWAGVAVAEVVAVEPADAAAFGVAGAAEVEDAAALEIAGGAVVEDAAALEVVQAVVLGDAAALEAVEAVVLEDTAALAAVETVVIDSVALFQTPLV